MLIKEICSKWTIVEIIIIIIIIIINKTVWKMKLHERMKLYKMRWIERLRLFFFFFLRNERLRLKIDTMKHVFIFIYFFMPCKVVIKQIWS